MIGPERLREIEPHVAGIAALHVLDTGIVDYAQVCRALAAEIEEAGATIRLRCAVTSGVDARSGLVVETTAGRSRRSASSRARASTPTRSRRR